MPDQPADDPDDDTLPDDTLPDDTLPDDSTSDEDTTTDDDTTTGTDEDTGEDEAADDPADDPGADAGTAPRDAMARLSHATDTDPATRSDASGRDVTPPPPLHMPTRNRGLTTEADPEDMDFREFDSGAPWTGDRPAPDRLEADTGSDAAGFPATAPPPAGTDPIEAVTTVLEADGLLDLFDLSVERAGDTIILRGSAATPQDRDRAGLLASGLPGVGRVQNLISAG